jgi:hypothetical protein
VDTTGGKRARSVLVGLLAVLGAGCAPDAAPPALSGGGGGAALAARALEISSAANVVGFFDLAEVRQQPEARSLAAQRFTWPFWRADAALLGFDPVDDASAVAVAAFAGSCGVVDVLALVAPSDPPGVVRRRIDAAVEAFRFDHPPEAAEEGSDAPDPALVQWVAVPDGVCTAVRRDPTDGEETAVTLTRDGLLLLRSTPFGHACSPGPKLEPSSEIAQVTAETGRALASVGRVSPPEARSVLGEALGDETAAAWMDDRGLHVEEPAPQAAEQGSPDDQ